MPVIMHNRSVSSHHGRVPPQIKVDNADTPPSWPHVLRDKFVSEIRDHYPCMTTLIHPFFSHEQMLEP